MLRRFQLLCTELARASTYSPLRPGCGQTGERSLPDQLALELRQSAEEMKYQPPASRCGVYTLGQTTQPNPFGLEPLHDLNEVRQRPTESIEPPNDEGIAGACMAQSLRQDGPLCRGSRRMLRKGTLATCLGQRIELQSGGLVIR